MQRSIFGLLAITFTVACGGEPVDPVDDEQDDDVVVCDAGFTAANGACIDINECRDNNGGCDENRECLNSEGSSSCGACRAGFETFGEFGCDDVDECLLDTDTCTANENCTNLPGSFSCSTCPTGFVADGRGACVDIDECLTDNGGCDALRECVNVDGGATCDDCPVGYANDGARRCTDVDECLTGNGGCDDRRACIDEEGASSCGACDAGFVVAGQTGCADIDECLLGTDTCAANRICINTVGAFACENCPPGFVTDNAGGCTDIDECSAGTDECSDQRACVNEDGDYRCGACPSGFEVDGEFACRDRNECLIGNGGCQNRACINEVGSRSCGACSVGFEEVDATRCSDIDECADEPCDPRTTCSNRPGSFACSACPGGLTRDGVVITGDELCPDHVVVELIGWTVSPAVSNGTTWDGGAAAADVFDRIADGLVDLDFRVGIAAALGGLLAGVTDPPDSFGNFAIVGGDEFLNAASTYRIFTQDNDHTPSLTSADFSPSSNLCGFARGPSFALSVSSTTSLQLALKDEDNLFDDDIGVVNLSRQQLVTAANNQDGAGIGSVFIDTAQGRAQAPILDVNVSVRAAFDDEVVEDRLECHDSCDFSFDGECDEPNLCAAGTDTFDCG